MKAANECSMLIARSVGLLKDYLMENDIENDAMIEDSIVLLESALDKMVDNMNKGN